VCLLVDTVDAGASAPLHEHTVEETLLRPREILMPHTSKALHRPDDLINPAYRNAGDRILIDLEP
jgi:hypothetical protein